MISVCRVRHHDSPGQVTRPHRPGAEADRQLCGVSLCSRQGYLRCLIKLDRLWEQGQTQLACGAHAAYYECVLLDAANGTPTPPGLSVAAYQRRLRGGGYDPAAAPAEEPRPAAQPQVGLIIADSLLASPPSTRPRPVRARGQPDLKEADLEQLAVAVMQQPADVELPEHLGREQPEVRPLLEIFVGLAEAAPAAERPLEGLPRRSRVALPAGVPVMLEGARLHLEEQRAEDGRVLRQGLRVVCRTHSVGGEVCSKYKVLSAASGRGIGPPLVAAYLGCWLRQAERHASRAAHVQLRPSDAQALAYGREAGLWA